MMGRYEIEYLRRQFQPYEKQENICGVQIPAGMRRGGGEDSEDINVTRESG